MRATRITIACAKIDTGDLGIDMTHRASRRRNWVAAIAVTALLLQGLLGSPASLIAMAAANVACPQPDGRGHHPADHDHADHRQCCILCGLGTSFGPPPPEGFGALFPKGRGNTVVTTGRWVAPAEHDRAGVSARGPPLTA
ncbi:MAG: hypothetical protein U1E56_04095 [Bauldia sp.]